MNNLITRSISGVVYVALIVASLLVGPNLFMGLMALFALLAVREFQTLTGSKSASTSMIFLINTVDIAAAAALCLATYDELRYILFDTLIIASYLVIRIVLALYDRRKEAFSSVGTSMLSIFYIGLPLAIAALLNRITHDNPTTRNIMLIIFIMIWLNDTGAYCVGSLLGRHRLCERLSPKKSWEGFWGGMAFCVAAGVVCHLSISTAVTPMRSLFIWTGLGVIVSIFSTWGDLFESLMKRTLGVKDSGHIIPGHGGILDRIDSLLLVAPASFIYAFLTGMF